MKPPCPRFAPFALLAALAPLFLPAAEVSSADAARAASAWVDRGYAMGKIPAGRTVAGADEVEDPATGARLRVVRFEGGGFVVLSADDLVDPVIAFSETGDGLDLDENNPFWALLRGDIAAREAAAGVERGAAAKAGAKRGTAKAAGQPTAAQSRWAALLEDEKPRKRGPSAAPSDLRVDSFVDSRWNQKTASAYSGTTDYCYNYYTPNHYHCGCVATAIGQMMRYFGKPTSSVAAATYPCEIDGTPTDMTMMGGTYDWSAMPAHPWESGTTENQRKAIGKLLYDVGVSVGMDWRSDGSGTQLYYGQNALREDFGYAQAVALLYQDFKDYYPWSLERFKQVVVPCFDARTPVGLSISRPGGAHAVFADGYGYSGGDFFIHVNFGWGSSADATTAWYCPPDLATDGSHPYDTISDILCNIFPDRTGNIFSGRVLDGLGSPVAGATVSFSDGQTATSDAHGIYAFVAPSGLYSATASADGLSGVACGELGETVPLTVSGRSSASYTPNKCGNSGGNDIVLSSVGPVATPVFSPGSGLFYPSTEVTISCATPGATIRYTLDGTIPTESSPAYYRPILVDDSCAIVARAFLAGRPASALGIANYAYDASSGHPKGDDFAYPIRIAGTAGSRVVESTAGYTTEDGEPYHTLVGNSRYNEYRTIWYRWTAPGSGRMSFRTTARTPTQSGYSLWHTAVAVYVGDDIRRLTRVAVNTEWDTTTGETVVELDVRRGRTYRIVGVSLQDKDWSFALQWSGDLLISNPAVLSVQ